MRKQTEAVFSRCPNYEKIINFKIEPGDLLSKRLIHYYQDYVLHTNSRQQEEIEKMKRIDQALEEYTKKKEFYRKTQTWFYEKKQEIEESNYFIDWIFSINNLYTNYLKEKENKKNTIWL